MFCILSASRLVNRIYLFVLYWTGDDLVDEEDADSPTPRCTRAYTIADTNELVNTGHTGVGHNMALFPLLNYQQMFACGGAGLASPPASYALYPSFVTSRYLSYLLRSSSHDIPVGFDREAAGLVSCFFWCSHRLSVFLF